ncbi:rhodanese-like domain-containing protein [Virgisporangium aurantiacum]|uniref:Sulfurtransferase n=1 Tax=Virgisporangium aurantiacum TaxID=175570 RepID=A0A8J3ZCV8_9ACTN|nr:rhodanese-like domain-containing protein [Virgisporangium aurantiacum]GIJ58898.1 sulfurtransferase [Virgisporangium aurantiacum]
MPKTITRDELRAAMNAGTVTVVDALPSGAFQRRHLPGAVNLAAEEIDRAPERLPDTDAPIVVYSTDSGCTRGPELADLLDARGYTDVRRYVDGIEDWVGAGQPIDTA